ncbi:cuticle protein-like [Cylas formicarius]|uniref:cuticle protein-like n=1 Tax=Cylas formicarius TaxID=197179 RepID=UPI002958873F|nr:cuticle protein-like [Cylas formicarius]
MFKLVVLSALVAVAVAKPSVLHHSAIEVAAPLAYSVPAAVSHTYREDVISKPHAVAVAAYAAPVVQKVAYAAPAVAAYAAPVVTKTVVAPAAVSHTYREDVISKPAYAAAYAAPVAYSAPVYAKSVVAAPVAYSAPVYAKSVVAAPAISYAAHVPSVHACQLFDSQHRPTNNFKMFKLVVLSALVAITVAKPSGVLHGAVQVATPIAYSVPAAVSHTYREDVIRKPAKVAAYAAPVVQKVATYAAPAVASYAAPVVAKTVVAPAAVSHTYRQDVIASKPTLVAKAVVAEPVVVAAPVVAKSVEVVPAVAAYAASPVAVAAPVAYSAHVGYSGSAIISGPVAQKTVISGPAVASPVLSYAVPDIKAW